MFCILFFMLNSASQMFNMYKQTKIKAFSKISVKIQSRLAKHFFDQHFMGKLKILKHRPKNLKTKNLL